MDQAAKQIQAGFRGMRIRNELIAQRNNQEKQVCSYLYETLSWHESMNLGSTSLIYCEVFLNPTKLEEFLSFLADWMNEIYIYLHPYVSSQIMDMREAAVTIQAGFKGFKTRQMMRAEKNKKSVLIVSMLISYRWWWSVSISWYYGSASDMEAQASIVACWMMVEYRLFWSMLEISQ